MQKLEKIQKKTKALTVRASGYREPLEEAALLDAFLTAETSAQCRLLSLSDKLLAGSLTPCARQ